MATPPENWTCSICYDPFPSSEKYCKIPETTDGHEHYYHACATCLRTQFLSAQENELNYPVKWQKQILHPRQFPSAFNQTFVRAYEAKEVEYKAPALERVYCECGTFVAPMVGEDARTSWVTLASSKLCSGCEARWCLRCAQRCGGFGVPHDCVPEKRLGERRLALGGLKKGKDFQICPGEGCARTIELAEACNAITCQCGTNFCYVCGAQAEPESEHWLRVDGGCPRYGVAGGAREIFDDDFGDAEHEADADAAFVMEERVVWERGEGESTTFDFIRWAWQATMAEDAAYIAQLDVMEGDPWSEAQSIDEVHRAMEMYHPVSRSGVSEEQWRQLVDQNTNAVRDWLSALHLFVRSGAGTVAEHLGGSLLDFPSDHLFNMAVAEDREAAAVWVEQANAAATQWTLGNDVELPGSAVFDVGPGGGPGERWRIRDMDMFEDVPALGLFKLAGGALLVKPRPGQVVERHLRGDLFGWPATDSDESSEHEEPTAGDEPAGDGATEHEIISHQTTEDDTAEDVAAEEETTKDESTEAADSKTAEEETTEGEAAEDETTGDNTAEDEIVEDESAKPDPHIREVNIRIVAGQQMMRVHRDALDPVFARLYPVLYAVLLPLSPLLRFLINDLLVGVINQEGYDHEFGLEYREQLEIPGSWLEGGESDERLYSDIVEPGWYSQDVALMRAMIWVACGLMLQSSFMDWRAAVRGW